MTELRDALDDYLALRRGLGFKLERPGQLLADFTGYLEAAGRRRSPPSWPWPGQPGQPMPTRHGGGCAWPRSARSPGT